MRLRGTKALVFGAICAALAGCEPPDDGGGAGLGGQLAFTRRAALVISSDDTLEESTLTDEGTSAEPALSSNGQTIVFAYSPTGGSGAKKGIYQVGISDRQLVRLAMPAGDETYSSPVFSKSGAKVYFVAEGSAASRLMEVAPGGGGTAAPVGGAPEDVKFPSPISDTKLLVVHGQALKILDLGTNTLQPLGVTTLSRGAVSPDGATVAYTADEGAGRIAVLDLETKTVTKLASTGAPEGDTKPCFSPDGMLVAFESKDKIYTARASGEGSVTPLQSGNDIAWGP